MTALPYRTFIMLTLASLFAGACIPSTYSIGDYTWNDENMNGIQDEGEGPIGSVEIALYNTDGSELQARTTSDKDGFYEFPGLPPGDYTLKFTPPSGFAITQKDAGEDDNVDSDINPSGNKMGWTDTFSLGAASDVSRDAGFFRSAPSSTPTPTPEGVIQSPTGQPITATPAPVSGNANVNLTITYDAAGHATFVKLGESTTVVVEQSNGIVQLTFSSPDGVTQISLSGPIDEDGAADLTGTGTVAGFPSVSGTFVGTVEAAAEGTILINGELTLGGNGELPQGEPIIYNLSN